MHRAFAWALLTVLFVLSAHPAAPKEPNLTGYRIAIDPGHQARLDDREEPVAPGKTETKPRAAGSAVGVATGKRESAVALEIALLLKDALSALGAEVLLVREAEEVQISNVQRAQMANQFQADVFLRLHCNDHANPSQRGIRVYAQKRYAERNFGMDRAQTLAWAESLAVHLQAETGAPSAKAYVTDTYSGSNWALMPTFLIEMGYLTNAEDDRLLQSDAYRAGLVRGIAAFVSNMPRDAYRDHPLLSAPVMENMRSPSDDLIVRVAPDDDARALRTVRRNHRVFVLDDLGGGWYAIQTYQGGETGYVHCDTLIPCR